MIHYGLIKQREIERGFSIKTIYGLKWIRLMISYYINDKADKENL